MKISLNWMRQFTDIDLAVDDLVEKIGAQLGAVEEVVDLGAKYKGIVVAKVVSCVDHPNADRLHVCKVDDGGITPDVNRDENGLVQVVCGAPNVREGLTVAWLPPGSTVPSSFDKDPFVLGSRELRGVVSNGMLASSKELAIGEDHSGILEVDIEASPGMSFADVYQLNDYIIDIENKMFTHRPDCFGILGVAREVAGIQHYKFVSPEWYLQALDRIKPGKTKLELTVRNEIPELVPRFMAVTMSGVQIKPSPVMIQTYLARVGVRPISNIVDITNYLMVLTGQPLHAYDYDKVAAQDSATTATIVVRKPNTGEKIKLLSGKEIEPRSEAAMIATETKLIGVGGVMGGADTEVDENTKNIILEAANFDMYSIRRTAMAHGLFTDAVTRFNKGQSCLQNDRIIEEAVTMVQSLSGAEVSNDVVDDFVDRENRTVPEKVTVTSKFINARLGCELSAEEMAELLTNVEFEVEVHSDELHVKSPFWRTDVEIPEDLVEEVGRLYGYDQLPLNLPERSLMPANRNPQIDIKSKVRSVLSKSGANEVMTYTFVHGNLLDKVGQDKEIAFQLSNALSPDLQYYRLSLSPSLLDKVHSNVKSGYDQFAIFEIGKAHVVGLNDVSGLPEEFERLALVFVADEKSEKQNFAGAAYYQAKLYLNEVLKSFGASGTVEFVALSDVSFGDDKQAEIMSLPFEANRSSVLVRDGKILGIVGEYKASVRKSLKLPDYVAGFEISTTLLMLGEVRSNYIPLPRFPSVEQDVCLKVDAAVEFDKVFKFVVDEVNNQKPDETLATFSPVDIYQRKDDKDHKQITIRLHLASYQRTLTDVEVTNILDKVSESAKESLGAERV